MQFIEKYNEIKLVDANFASNKMIITLRIYSILRLINYMLLSRPCF